MKKRVLIASSLSLTLMTAPLTSNFVKAAEMPNESLNQSANGLFDFSADGVSYKTLEDKKFRTVVVKDPQGTKTFKTNKTTGHIYVESDYLSSADVQNVEKQINQIKVDVDAPATIATAGPVQGMTSDQNNAPIINESITGKWVWSNWDSYTITVEGKATTQIITAAILSRIPYVGWAAAALASVMIQYKMKTGYFKRRGGTAADTNPDYLWSKMQVNLYKDKARKILISSKTSSPSKVRVY